MSVLTGKELRIVGFLCNWCSYGGADTAGVARFTQPTDLRIIRVPCSGRVNPLFPLKALLSGADGVLVSGCHPRDCHYSEGNYYARRRLETLKEFLPIIGIDPRRFEYTWVSASEGQRWQAVVTAFTERVHKLGPAPKFEDAKPMYVMPNLDLPAPLRPLGCGVNPTAMTELKGQIKAALEAKEVEFVMGWQKGFDGLHATPLYMRKPEDVEKLIWGPLNVHSLATYLPLFKGKKVGIVVKGCDSRGVVELLQENLINREDVVVFGMGCNGTIDINRVLAKIGDVTEVESVTGSGATLKVRADGKDYEFAMQDVAQDKCRACTVPNAVIHDHFAGSPTNIPDGAQPAMPAIMTFLDGLSLEDRMGPHRPLHPLLCLPQRLPHVRVPRQLRGGQPRTALAHAGRQPHAEDVLPAHPRDAPRRTLHRLRRMQPRLPDGHPGRSPQAPDGPRREEAVRIRARHGR